MSTTWKIDKLPSFRTLANMAGNHFARGILCVMVITALTSAQTCTNSRACYPQFVDLIVDSPSRSVAINSTCGDPPSQFELRISTASGDVFSLETCNASDPANAHPPSALHDVTTFEIFNQVFVSPQLGTWWQSENNARDVYLTLDLGDEFLFQETVLSFRNYRPTSMVIEKTLDNGLTWTPLRYFATSCAVYFPGVPVSDTFDFNADCREEYVFGHSQTEVDGDIQQAIYNPVQELGESYFEYDYQRYFAFTGLRIGLLQPGRAEELRSYFAVADWNVQGQCLCYGHAAACMGMNQAECVCQHNTMGTHCDMCQPLYNNRLWQPALGTDANICQDCGCSGRAESCVYDEVKGYGVCQNCTENTSGDKCEVCLEDYYRNPYTDPTLNDTCIDSESPYPCTQYCWSCNCTLEGTIPSTVCNETNGQCECKANVQGRSCDECKDTFYNLQESNGDGCQECDCDPVGTEGSVNLCDKETGECICKENVMGVRCDQCQPGTFNLDQANLDGCTPCDCDPGAAISGSCDPLTGACTCRQNVVGRACNDTEPGFYVPRLDGIMVEAEMATSDQPTSIEERALTEEEGHTGPGFLVVSMATTVTFSGINIPQTQNYVVIVRYETASLWTDVEIQLTTSDNTEFTCLGLLTSPNSSVMVDLPATDYGGAAELTTQCLRGGSTYDVIFSLNTTDGGSAAEILLDSVVLLPVLDDLEVYRSNSTSDEMRALAEDCWLTSVAAGPRSRSNCSEVEFAIMAEVFNGAVACDCSPLGSESTQVCESFGGQCPCLPGVIARSCDICAPFTYGIESGTGCTDCDCDLLGSVTQSCNQTSGVCDCKQNVGGDKCSACQTDHYGLATGEGCVPCDCAPEFSLGSSCTDEGQCTCKVGVRGLNCTQCSLGFFNLTSDGCVECDCNTRGSVDRGCDSQGQCICLPSTTGTNCDECREGSYGFGPYSERGCIECLCSSHTTNCSSADNWYVSLVESHYSLLNLEGAVSERWTGITETGAVVELASEPILEISDPRFVLEFMDPGNSSNLFFVSPSPYLGDHRTAYGQMFEFTLSQTTSDNLTFSPEGDVFIFGGQVDTPLVASLPSPPFSPVDNATTYQIKLHENYWNLGSVSGPRPAMAQVVRILADIAEIQIRAKYSTLPSQSVYFHDAVLFEATMVANASSNNIRADFVENCSCPPEYTGQFCESCAPGYRRATIGGDSFTDCIPCDCNGHSALPCDVETGVCSQCGDNTAGDFCQMCQDGYYGNATIGTSDDCQPCQCPGVPGTNSFAATCDDNGVCIDCREGHGGENCEFCVEGYYGVPTDIDNNGGECQPCFCNLSPDTCDSTTGQCLNCTGNTSGRTCEVCDFGYWGSIDNCQECTCNLTGGHGNCTQDAGICYCYPNVVGAQCTKCAPDSWGFASGSGCTDCNCHPVGTQDGQTQCDLITGQCSCKDRVIGQQCDQCIMGYYAVDQECIACNCNMNGTTLSTCSNGSCSCDQVTGQCGCKLATIAGRTCDQCGRLEQDTVQVVEEIFVGRFPNCEPCPECFQNWRNELELLGEQLVGERMKLLQLLGNYGNLTDEEVGGLLTSLRGNLTYADQVIAEGNLEAERLQNIQSAFVMISLLLENQTAQLDHLSALERNITALLAATAEFAGSVEVEPGVMRTSDRLNQELSAVLNTIEGVAADGFTEWTAVQRIYGETQALQAQAQRLLVEVNDLVRDVEDAASQRGTVEGILATPSRVGEVEENQQRLQLIASLQEEYPLEFTQLNASASQELVGTANDTATEALQRAQDGRQVTQGNVYRSEVARFNASQAAVATMMATTAVLTYQELAMGARENITSAYIDTLLALAQLDAAETDSEEALQAAIATQVMQVQSPSEMETLVEQINQTSLSDSTISPLLANASASLSSAEDILNASKQALQDAYAVRSQLNTIEYELAEAERIREEVAEVSEETARNVTNINDITNQVQELSTSRLNEAEVTSALVADLQQSAIEGQECFSAKRAQAEDASRRADRARQGTEVTQEELVSVQAEAISLSADVTMAMDDSSENLESISDVRSDAATLNSDVLTVADMATLDALIREYTDQRSEMDNMKRVLDQMEASLDAVLDNLQGIGTGEIQCNN
ncbi:laminin subunit alpha-1-like [Diadema antillarum]|uniref:laminin subunit alpha-1-like n=1 Tax=Diadema antillarum TaxID=105358 RepID=UPI003A883432